MSVLDRIKKRQLAIDEIVVIGSGLLDAYDLREASDIDLVVTRRLFDELKDSGLYRWSVKHGDECLSDNEFEIWLRWDKDEDFESLRKGAVIIDDVAFVAPKVIFKHKQKRGTAKDINDIILLENYLNER